MEPGQAEADWATGEEQEEDEDESSMSGANLAIVILATLLTASLMFCSVFLYYYKAKDYVDQFMEDKGLEFPSLPSMPAMPTRLPKPSMPSIPSMPSMPRMPRFKLPSGQGVRGLCKLEKLEKLTWPLSNVSFSDKLPSFINKNSSSPVVPANIAPVPPPRLRKARYPAPAPPTQQPPRLATIQPRSHPRPPAPPPVAPPGRTTATGAPILEISSPTEVTINGVTVRKPSPMSMTAAGPTPSSSGIICAAQPAMAMSDVPDSSLEPSLPPPLPSIPPPHFSSLASSNISQPPPLPKCPPPLPTCPPPDSLDENCTDA